MQRNVFSSDWVSSIKPPHNLAPVILLNNFVTYSTVQQVFVSTFDTSLALMISASIIFFFSVT